MSQNDSSGHKAHSIDHPSNPSSNTKTEETLTASSSVSNSSPQPTPLSATSHNSEKADPEKAQMGESTPNKQRSAVPRTAKFPFVNESLCVISGIVLMLAGTLIVNLALLPKIYVCPDGATCRHNLDPRGNIIPRLQALMEYCLQGGVMIAGLGLTKLMAYDSYFVLKKSKGSTIRTLEMQIHAVEGSWIDASLLALEPLTSRVKPIFRRHTPPNRQVTIRHGTRRWILGILTLIQVAIGLFIPFIVGFSISDLHGQKSVHVPFNYHSNFTLPRADQRYFSNDERIVAGQLNNWFLSSDGPRKPITVFDGTLVLRDNRTISPTNAQPSGSRITGNISCSGQGWNASLLPPDSPYLSDGHAVLPSGANAYNISDGVLWRVTYSYTSLASTFITLPELSDSITSRQYLWASNTSNTIPNAKASPDGNIHFAVCNHTIYLVDLSPIESPPFQAILPSQPTIYTNADDPFLDPCPSNDPMACVSWSVDDIVLAWWQTNIVQQDLADMSCWAGLIAGYSGVSDTSQCVLDDARWAATVGSTLDALIDTAPVFGNASQDLWTTAESINADRWWIQTILPGVTFLLFLACVAYTMNLSDGSTSGLRELDLATILHDTNPPEPGATKDIQDDIVTLKAVPT